MTYYFNHVQMLNVQFLNKNNMINNKYQLNLFNNFLHKCMNSSFKTNNPYKKLDYIQTLSNSYKDKSSGVLSIFKKIM